MVEGIPKFPSVHKYCLADINYGHMFSPVSGLLQCGADVAEGFSEKRQH